MEAEGFNVVTTPEKGRCLYATRQYKEGDKIFSETPLVSCQLSWNAAYKYLACDYCMRPLETAEENIRRLAQNRQIELPFPEFCPTTPIIAQFTKCPQCNVAYCSEQCRLEALPKYHETLCLGADSSNLDNPINKLNEVWKTLHYPPETCSIMLICRILAMIRQAKNQDEVSAQFNDFQAMGVNHNLMVFHKILGENYAQDLDKLYQLTKIAFPDEKLSVIQTVDGFKSLFLLIGTNGQGIGTSPFSVWERKVTASMDGASDEFNALDTFINDLYNKMDEVSGVFLNSEGTGLYSLQSKINHSCAPNAEITFPYSNHVLSVKAIADIKPGEEICISYIDDCTLSRSRHSRQKELKENYLFLCTCAMCEEQKDDPDATSEEESDDDMDAD